MMVTVSESDMAPPVPVLPWSFVVIVTDAFPMKAVVGVNDMPPSAVLMLLRVPVKVIVASAVPSPVVKVSPVVLLRVKVP